MTASLTKEIRFYFIAEVTGYDYYENGADAIVLMYEPISRTVLFTFDYI